MVLIVWRRIREHDDLGERENQKGALSRTAGVVLLSLLLAVSSAAPSPRRIEIAAKRYSFEPAEITIKTGESVDLVVTSGDVTHGLRVRELNINVRASKGKPGEVKFTPERAGTFIGHCSVFCGAGHGKMTFTIHVVA
jgi:cytochrome c oxidase subunit 2